MQKLVTVYLDNLSYVQGKWRKAAHGDQHGLVEEHLEEYLSQGWKITDIHSFGGSADVAAKGWIVVLLEK
jgi:hypothetical protein